MEFWDIYDVNRIKTGNIIKRGDNLDKNAYHLVVAVCVFNSDGEMLIQQRQHDKIGWPNKWDITAAGSATEGEHSSLAAGRELFEEIGLDIDFTDKRPVLTVNFSRGFSDYYCMEKDVALDDLVLQEEEVQDVRWATRETIHKMIENGEFIPYYKSLIDALFEMKNASGSFTKDYK